MAIEGKKLQIEGIPKLGEQDLSVRAVVRWRAATAGWFKAQGLEEYTVARALPLGATPEQRRMGLRYVLAGIESAELKDAIADEANDGPSAWQFIANEFLHGRDE